MIQVEQQRVFGERDNVYRELIQAVSHILNDKP